MQDYTMLHLGTQNKILWKYSIDIWLLPHHEKSAKYGYH